MLETLRKGKNLIAVVNEDLQENHQVELASALADNGHCFWCTVATLCPTIRDADFSTRIPLPPIDTEAFPRAVAATMGFAAVDD